MDASDPEDFLFDSLQTLYDYQPVIIASSGSYTYKYLSPTPTGSSATSITVHTPDTQKENWSLHASSIWRSSIFLADHHENLQIAHLSQLKGPNEKLHILELGASAGLPSILLANVYDNVVVTASDYSDDCLMQALAKNIQNNDVSSRCKAVSYNWGSDPTILLGGTDGFDLIMAADTLWASDFHGIFLESLSMTLKKTFYSRIHLVAGLHTGRYTLQSFLNGIAAHGLAVESIVEHEVTGNGTRDWCVSREDNEIERRRWVLWIKLKWDFKKPENI